MHELTVLDNLLRISAKVAEENNLSRVTMINVDVGNMQHLNEDIMKHGFEAVKQGTIFAGAELRLHRLDVKLRCNACLKEFIPESGKFFCPFCGDKDTSVTQGMELIINSIEGE